MVWSVFERDLNIWDPWRELRQLKSEMDRVLGRNVPDKYLVPTEFPAVNIWSNNDEIILTAEIPGLESKNLNVSVQNDQLTIRGSRGCHECTEGELFHRQERGAGEFVRTVGLPFSINTENVEALYRNGVLKVTLPRSEQDKPRQITIKA